MNRAALSAHAVLPRRAGVSLLVLALASGLSGACLSLPDGPAERALYLDLRKIVDANEDGGWTVDRVRLEANAEPTLRSACQVEPQIIQALDAWLGTEIARVGGPAKEAYLAHGRSLAAASQALSLERTLALLRYAEAQVPRSCPFWLEPKRDFAGEQGDAQRWVLLGETQAFVAFTLPGNVPALGGGGRLFLGHGIGSRVTLAGGADIAASGTFIPTNARGGGVDAYLTLATPVLVRGTIYSRLFDVELAPVLRLMQGQPTWPPGARIQIGGGFSSLRISPVMPYFMFYVGYEVHPSSGRSDVDHTFQLGTRIALDGAL